MVPDPPRPLQPLPAAVVRAPLDLTAARGLGLSRRELEGPLWQRLGHGLHGWYDLDAADPTVRTAVVAASQPPGTVLGGWAALHHQGVSLLDGRTGAGAERLVPVLIHVGPRGRTRPTPLLHVDRGLLDPGDIVEHDGRCVMSPVAACVAIACRYGVEEGLVAADAAVAAGLVDKTELSERVARAGRVRGVPHARLVAALVDGRSVSPPESRLRYVWIVLAGLPKPVVNPVVVDEDGWFVGKPDLLDPGAGATGEYDGAQHRDLRQHTDDNDREESFERVNLVVARATAVDLWSRRARLVWRLQDAYRRGQSRDRARDRWDWRLS
jgi:hypothetical protein